MKKLTLLLLALAMCASLFMFTGCNGDGSSSVNFENGGAEIDDDMIGFENSDDASKNTNGGIWTDGK